MLFDARTALGHEFWIAPWKYQVQSDSIVTADFRNGEGFKGSELAYFDTQLRRADVIQGSDITAYTGRLGDIPAVKLIPNGEGLLTLAVITRPAQVKYKSWENFTAFAEHQDLKGVIERHLARDLPRIDFWESYTRYTKSLLAVGHGRGQDADRGMETEFVTLANPYTDELNGSLPVRLLYQGTPRINAQIEVFEKSPHGIVSTRMIRTDAQGLANIPVRPGQEYLLNAVVVRPAPDGERPVWETLWASLTFTLPKT